MADMIHPAEYLRKRLLSDKDIQISELKLVISQVKNNSFIYDKQKADALESQIDELSKSFNEFLNPEIVDK